MDDGPGLNAGALSQISSANDGKESPPPQQRATQATFAIESATGIGSNRASAYPQKSAVLPPRNHKTRSNVGLQERRLRQNDENNRKALLRLDKG